MSDTLPSLPEPDTEAIYVHAAEGRVGPLSRRQLDAKLAAGELSGAHHFWFAGMEGWKKLSDHLSQLSLGGTAPAAPAALQKVGSADDQMDALFGKLVSESWKYYEAHNFASHIDEVFLGSLITTTLDTGCVLIDLSSDGTHHYLRFENLDDQSRLVYRMTHLTSGLTEARVQGQRASVVVGYGARVDDFQKVWKALQAEFKSGYISTPEPGTMTVDGDMNSGYVYVQVDLYLKLDDYIEEDYAVDYARLKEHLAACHNALRKYLRGRFA